jgi:aryl-alcohol dehydrogenase-like predicted oxidoreductase
LKPTSLLSRAAISQDQEAIMRTRPFGRTGWAIGEIGFGTWALGADWGAVDDREGIRALHEALDHGVNFIDTADVYGDGRSERLIAQALKEHSGARPIIATKAGRRLKVLEAAGFTRENLRSFVDRSLQNLGVETIDLLQLHCPPTDAFYRPEIFEALDDLVRQGKIIHYGASVEKVEEAIKAIEYPGVVSIQIIFNIFRQRPAEMFFKMAQQRGVAIIVRVPLASGLLSGKFKPDSRFEASDHRTYNRNGEAFDVGETFSGVPYDLGLAAVEEIRPLVPAGTSMAQFALRWILMHEAVSVVIPGAKNVRQALDNTAAADLPPLADDVMARLGAIYEQRVKPYVHQRW